MAHNAETEGAASEQRIMRSAYRWNTAGGILFALQSTIMLIALTRVCDVYVAGVFTIAFANANLFMQISNFGMRKFQASDRRGEFSFRTYRASRVSTCTAMIVASLAYIAYSGLTLGYDQEKILVMVVMCLFKAIDSFEDVFTGGYQVQGRLDLGAKMLTIRLLIVSAVFIGFIVVTGDLLSSSIATTVTSAVVLGAQIGYVRRAYNLPNREIGPTVSSVLRLLRACVPLFLGDFLLFYAGNAARYAIDVFLDDAAQAYFGYIAMPVFVVTLLAGFIYSPLITSLTDQWHEGKVGIFAVRFAKLSLVVAGITVVCAIGVWLVGVPVLNALYNTELESYKLELCVLMVGGGFLAFTTLLTVGITIIRFQLILVPLYAISALFARFISYYAVANFSLAGAAWSYLAVMALSSVVFALAFAFGIWWLRPKVKQ